MLRAGSARDELRTGDALYRLTEVISGTVTTFVYDGDGRRVKKVDEGGTTVYVGEHYEVRHETIPWQELLDGWQQITGTWPSCGIEDFEEFDGNLYTGCGSASIGDEVARLRNPDLASEREIAGTVSTGADILASWRGYLWAVSEWWSYMHRSSDGVNWESVEEPANMNGKVFAAVDNQLFVREELGWTAVYTFSANITALEEFNGFLFVGSPYQSWRNAPLNGKKPESSQQVTKHYYANGQRVATRVDGTLYYVHSDLLGSNVAVSDAAGQAVGRVQAPPTHFSGIFDVRWNAQDPSANGSTGPSSLLRIDSLHTTQSGTVAGF